MRLMNGVSEVEIGGVGTHGIECRCLVDEPYPCPWHGYDNRTIDQVVAPYIEEWKQLNGTAFDYKFGMVRTVNEEFRTVKYKYPVWKKDCGEGLGMRKE